MSNSIKLLIVDDSKLIRRFLHALFLESGQVQTVGEAENGQQALEMIPHLTPDVVTLDVNMPVMDGITALKHIMIKYPRPIVMLSAFTKEGERITFDALKYGAVDFITKPSQMQPVSLLEQKGRIVEKVKMAARVELKAVRYFRFQPSPVPSMTGDAPPCRYVVALGASVGGYNALLKLILQLKPDLPAAFLIVHYAAPEHLDRFVAYLDQESPVPVKRAINGERPRGGVCYLASGEEYVNLLPVDNQVQLQVNPRPFRHHRGAINRLFFSAAEAMKDRAVGVILSGCGEDGVEGLEEIIRLGGISVVQDPKTCLCPETSDLALRRCRVDWTVPDAELPSRLDSLVRG